MHQKISALFSNRSYQSVRNRREEIQIGNKTNRISEEELEAVSGGAGDILPTNSEDTARFPVLGFDTGTIDDESLTAIREVSRIISDFTSQPTNISREI